MIVDTHCHLYYDELNKNLEDTISKSEKAGIEKIIVPAVDLETSIQVTEMSEIYPMLYAVIGIHPCDIKDSNADVFEKLIPLFENKKVIGIGETGLDYYWDKSETEKQKEFFIHQLRLGKKYNLPVVVHSRDSVADAIKIIKSEYSETLKIQMHCFSGNIEETNQLLELENIYFSFCGNVTFKNFHDFDIVRLIPVDRLLFETDSPFLTPMPFRGKTNFPYHIIHTINKISTIKNTPENELIDTVRENTKRFFGI
jgi:TatD DNase family protein